MASAVCKASHKGVFSGSVAMRRNLFLTAQTIKTYAGFGVFLHSLSPGERRVGGELSSKGGASEGTLSVCVRAL